MRYLLLAPIAMLLACLLVSPVHGQPTVVVEPAVVDFGTVVEGAVIEPEVTVRNTGPTSLRLRGAQMLSPLVATRMPATIGPGLAAVLRFRLDTLTLLGPFESDVVLLGPDNAEAGHFVVAGRVLPIVASEPGIVLLATLPGERKSVEAQIVNHDAAAVDAALETVPEGITARLTTLEAGRRFRLDLESTGTMPAGRHRLIVSLRTTNPKRPVLRVPVNLLIRERVYTFPEQVEFGEVPMADARRDPARLTQTLMVYQQGGRTFHARFETNVSGVIISAEPGPTGDRWQATLRLDPQRHGVGQIHGTVVITTDDPQFPRLLVPLGGALTN